MSRSLTPRATSQIVPALLDQPNFGNLTIDLAGTKLFYDSVITAIISFLKVATAVFFVWRAHKAAQKEEEPADDAPSVPSEVALLTEIRDSLRAH